MSNNLADWMIFFGSLTPKEQDSYDGTCNCVACEAIRARFRQYQKDNIMTTTPNAPDARRYDDDEIERITDFGIEITPDEWVKEFHKIGRSSMALDYILVYGLDFMANAPAIIAQLRADLRAARAEIEAAKAHRSNADNMRVIASGELQRHGADISEFEYFKRFSEGE